jgi:hypothetical protein
MRGYEKFIYEESKRFFTSGEYFVISLFRNENGWGNIHDYSDKSPKIIFTVTET